MKIELDISALDNLLNKLKAKETDYKPKVENAMREAWQKVDKEIESSVSPHYRPQSRLRNSRIKDFRPRWEGETLSVPVGFDFSLPGAVHVILLRNGTGDRSTRGGYRPPHRTGSMPRDGAVHSATDSDNIQAKAMDVVRDKLVKEIFSDL